MFFLGLVNNLKIAKYRQATSSMYLKVSFQVVMTYK